MECVVIGVVIEVKLRLFATVSSASDLTKDVASIPSNISAFRLLISVVEETLNGAVPVAWVKVPLRNCISPIEVKSPLLLIFATSVLPVDSLKIIEVLYWR